MARRLAALFVVLALAGCASPAGSTPPASPSAVATPPGPTEVPTAPPPMPPVPAGVTPATDQVVLRAWAYGDVMPFDPLPVTVYADGSVLEPMVERLDAPGVRQLTPAGLDRLLARVRASGLFTTSRTIKPLRALESGFTTFRIEMRDAGHRVTVEASNVAPAPEARALIELAESILQPPEPIDPADWVGGNAAALPYRARMTRLTSELVAFPPGSWRRPSTEVGSLAWPLPGSPLEVGQPVVVPETPARAIRCALVTGMDEARLRLALEAARADRGPGDMLARSWDLSVPALHGILRVSVRPFLPEEPAACDAVPLPEAPVPEPPPPASFADTWTAARAGVEVAGAPLAIVDVFRSGAGGGPVATLTYSADGSILQLTDPRGSASGIGVRTLSPAGLGRLRTLLDDPGLPDADLDERPPDEVQEVTWYTVEGLLRGTWRTAAVTDWRPSREASAVIALARSLADPEAWAGPGGWLGGDATTRPWRPDRIELQVETYPDEAGAGRLVPASRVRWPLDGALEDPRCEMHGFDATDALVRALAAAGAEATGGPLNGMYELAGVTPESLVRLSLRVLTPGDESSCQAMGF